MCVPEPDTVDVTELECRRKERGKDSKKTQKRDAIGLNSTVSCDYDKHLFRHGRFCHPIALFSRMHTLAAFEVW